jgi:hypothetical protein
MAYIDLLKVAEVHELQTSVNEIPLCGSNKHFDQNALVSVLLPLDMFVLVASHCPSVPQYIPALRANIN